MTRPMPPSPPAPDPREDNGSQPPSARDGAINRRRFLSWAGTGLASLPLSRAWPATAGPFEAGDIPDHHVPRDKKLHPRWVGQLTERGEPIWYRGGDLDTIGMPVGGICAGQVYLAGDGRLLYWDIFNRNLNTGYGAINYKAGRTPTEVANVQAYRAALDLKQGFAIRLDGQGEQHTRTLDRTGFPTVRFRGEYPIGRVDYDDPGLPAHIGLEAFSPFVPLNSEDSALPATLLMYTVTNRSAGALRVTLGGWLENRICPDSGERFAGRIESTNEFLSFAGATGFLARVRPRADIPAGAERDPAMFADFEAGDYGAWQATGEAFGDAPAGGTLPGQQNVSGFVGNGLVNTFRGGDGPRGRLVSPAFTIERPWISFLIGGGSHADKTCMNLVIDGEIARTARGRDNERLLPHDWPVQDLVGRTAHLEILDEESGGWGHINIDQITFRDVPAGADLTSLAEQADAGSMGLAMIGGGEADVLPGLPAGDPAAAVLTSPPADGRNPVARPIEQALLGGLRTAFELAPGETRTVPFVVAWHLPNLHRDGQRVGNHYARRFSHAGDVIGYLAEHQVRLTRETRLWRDSYYDSTLPYWLLDRLHAPVANLATTTCQWWKNGRFWAWEGCGCCHGTCGHVWNYAHALARLFPDLERSVREMQDFAPGVGLHPETGSIGFRGEGWDLWAGDAQGGYILKAYREHGCSGDDEFLARLWPRIRQATQFLIEQDGNDDGLIEGRQHQTYDQDYYGPNTMVGSLYLGALRAAEEMARERGDTAFADTCRAIFERGRSQSMKRLFNGEYFVQDVDLSLHPDWQYADGCLADQLFGQGWAHQLDLGYLYPADAVKRTLRSIWEYCWTPDIGPQSEAHKPERWFAHAGEAGLFTCTWPKSRHLGPTSTRYRNEIWTGIEYQVANHMAWEGMTTEALATIRAIHERYHPAKHNPWNEIECGDHYARAMASWGVLISLAGFVYHGPARRIGFAPRITPDAFQCIFTAAEGWGTLRQERAGQAQTNTLDLKWGRLAVRELVLEPGGNGQPMNCTVQLDDRALAASVSPREGRVYITLAEDLIQVAGQRLQVTFGALPGRRPAPG